MDAAFSVNVLDSCVDSSVALEDVDLAESVDTDCSDSDFLGDSVRGGGGGIGGGGARDVEVDCCWVCVGRGNGFGLGV